MKHSISTLLFIIGLLITSCSFGYQKKTEVITLEESNAIIKLEIESKGFISTVTGSSEGPELFQKTGNLNDVIKSFNPEKNLMIKGIPNKNTYRLEVRNYPSDKVIVLEKDILDFMAKEIGFSWKIEEGNALFNAFEIVNHQLLSNAKSTNLGVDKMISINRGQLKFVGSLPQLAEVLEENLPELSFNSNFPKIDFKIEVELPIRNQKKLNEVLTSKYGLKLDQANGTKETLIISKK